MTDEVDFALRRQEAHGYAAVREVLRDAAHDMIRTGGLRELSMRGLAARVGLSAMATYRYYDAKDALVEDVRGYVMQNFAECLLKAAACAADPVSSFCRMCMAYLDFATANEEDYRLMFAPEGQGAENGAAGMSAPAGSILFDVLDSMGSADDPRSTSEKAHLVWATLHGLAMLHLSRRLVFDRSVQTLREPMIAFLLEALRVT